MSYDSRPATYEHIAEVRRLMLRVVQELLARAHEHDASKLVSPEVETFDLVTPELRRCVYGSDEYKAMLDVMEPALAHHYGVNPHHPEHHDEGVADMTLMDVVEMLCDWIAASKRTKDGDALKSIRAINQERFGLDELLTRILENTARKLEA